MAIIARDSGGGLPPVSEGVHMAVCTGVIDIGDQWNEQYGKTARRVVLMWELDESAAPEGQEKKRHICREYTLSLHSKGNLRRDLEAWRGRSFTGEELSGFDLKNILGKGCQIQVIHTEDKRYANIACIMTLPRGMASPAPQGELIYFDLNDKGSLKLLDKLPQWIREKVLGSETYRALSGQGPAEEELMEATPFDDAELPF